MHSLTEVLIPAGAVVRKVDRVRPAAAAVKPGPLGVTVQMLLLLLLLPLAAKQVGVGRCGRHQPREDAVVGYLVQERQSQRLLLALSGRCAAAVAAELAV